MTNAPQNTTQPAGPQRIRRVFVRELEIVASVGVYRAEQHYEQRVLISVDLQVVDDYDGQSEKLADVLDYGRLADSIERLAQSAHFTLIETLAARIAELALEDQRVIKALVRVEKPDILPAARSVGIEIERTRAQG